MGYYSICYWLSGRGLPHAPSRKHQIKKIIGHHVDRQSCVWINPSLYMLWAWFRCSQISQYGIGNSWIKSSRHVCTQTCVQSDSLTVAQKKKKVNKRQTNCVAKNRAGLQHQQEGRCFIWTFVVLPLKSNILVDRIGLLIKESPVKSPTSPIMWGHNVKLAI